MCKRRKTYAYPCRNIHIQTQALRALVINCGCAIATGNAHHAHKMSPNLRSLHIRCKHMS
jgi:hypothetical protein